MDVGGGQMVGYNSFSWESSGRTRIYFIYDFRVIKSFYDTLDGWLAGWTDIVIIRQTQGGLSLSLVGFRNINIHCVIISTPDHPRSVVLKVCQ